MRLIAFLNVLQRGDEFEGGGKGAGKARDDDDAHYVILILNTLGLMARVTTMKLYRRFQARCLGIRSVLQTAVAAASQQHIGE